jgi:hypothetical protein
MRRIGLLALTAAATVAAAGAVTATGATRVAPPKVKNTRGWIDAIAMDGPLVAYATDDSVSHCRKVVVWNVLTGGGTLVSGPKAGTCGDDEPHGQHVTAVAIGGGRVAWIRNITGNTESDDYLFSASLVRPTERRLAWTMRVGDTSGDLKGNWLGGLVGSGSLLAVNTWTTDARGAVTTGALRTITAAGLKTIVSGQRSLVARSADLGRAAVLRSDGTVAIYSSSGRLLRTIMPGPAKEIALRKDYLVVLTRSRTLEIYNSRTGAPVRTWPVPGGAAHLDVHSGIAVFSVGRRVYALQLTTGKDVVLATAVRAIDGVQIEAPGVVYAFDTVRGTTDIGNIAFVPLARAVAAVS